MSRPFRLRRLAVACVAACCFNAHAADPVALDIPAQSLAAALAQFSSQSGVKALYAADLLAGKTAPRVAGKLTPDAALAELLKDSGLTWRVVGDGAVRIEPAPRSAAPTVTLPAIDVKPSGDEGGTLVVPNTAQATAAMRRVAGGAEVVPDTAYKGGRAQSMKDALLAVPGVYTTEPRYGEDLRISIRGSALSRPYGNRGLNIYMDGVPVNTSDGLVDLFEIDPTAYRYMEVFKGGNAMRYGSNSLGGAINMVTPTGYDASPLEARIDAGSFGYGRVQASSGGVSGAMDYFLTASAQTADGYRDHSDGNQQRASGSLGFRIAPDLETRFYVNLNRTRNRLPGEVTKASALNTPEAANAFWVFRDQQRNIDSYRFSNKTTWRAGEHTTVDFGLFTVYRHVDHPIFLYLDYDVRDYGGFARLTDERTLAGHRNVFVAGATQHQGTLDGSYNAYSATDPTARGTFVIRAFHDTPTNTSVYFDNNFYVRPDVAINVGAQFLHAGRDHEDPLVPANSGSLTFNETTPKLGVLWDLDPSTQVFANVSKSAEVPTYDVNGSYAALNATKAQTAVTYEVGTRGQRAGVNWDVSLYRAQVKNELQCLNIGAGCTTVNAGRTIHQGVEAGLGVRVLESVFRHGDQVTLNGTYLYNDFSFDNDATYGDNQLAGVPRQLLRAETLYRQPTGFYAGPSVEWMPDSYYVDNANTTTVDSYAVWNLRVGFDNPKPGWSGYLEGRNLADKRYIAVVDVVGTGAPTDEIFHPGTGRSFNAGLRYSW